MEARRQKIVLYATGTFTAVVVTAVVVMLALFPGGNASLITEAAGIYTASANDGDGNALLASNSVNDTYVYDTSTDSDAATQQKLGIDPNWKNGVTRKSYGLKFDGIDDYGDLGNRSAYDYSAHTTYSLWFKSPAIVDGTPHMIIQRFNGGSPGAGFWAGFYGSKKIKFEMRADPTGVGGTTIADYDDNQWHFLVYQIDTVAKTAYVTVDGSETIGGSYTGTALNNIASLTIGSQRGLYPFIGYVDDVRLYQRTLTADELGALKNRQSISDEGLIGLWKLDEGSGTQVLDSSQYGNDGVLKNSSSNTPAADGTANGPIWVTGSNAVMDGFEGCGPEDGNCTVPSGKAGAGNVSLTEDSSTTSDNGYEVKMTASPGLLFDGTNDYVDVGNSSNLVLTSAGTISLWIKPTVSDSSYRLLYNKEGEYELIYRSGTLQYAIANTTPGWVYTDTGYAPALNTWTHIVFTYNQAQGAIKLYANGSSAYSAAGSGAIGDGIPAKNRLFFGWREDFSAVPFKGYLDDARVYARTLSDQEVASLYAGESVSNLSLAGWWKFNEGSGTALTDNSGNTNAGSLQNGSTNSPAADGTTNGPVWVEGVATPASKTSDSPAWAMPGYEYREQLKISNPNGSVLPAGYSVNSSTTRESKLNANQTRADGNDWRIVYQPTDPTRSLQATTGNFARIPVRGTPGGRFNTNTNGATFSYSAWIKAPSYSTGTWQAILTYNASCNNQGAFTIYAQNGSLYFAYYSIGNGVVAAVSSGAVLKNNTWQHIVWTKTFGQTDTTLYVDGQRTTVNISNGTESWLGQAGYSPNMDSLLIGAYNGDGSTCTAGVSAGITSHYFNGFVDDIRIYDSILNQGEVSALYQGGAGTPGAVKSGLIGWWRLDEGSGQIIQDSSDGAEHGSLGAGTASASDDAAWSTDGTVSTRYEIPRYIPTGHALRFDGVDDYVNVTTEAVSTSQIRSTGVTYSAWIKPENVSGNQTIFGQRPGGGYSDLASGGLTLNATGQARMVAFDDTSSYKNAVSSHSLTANTWTFLTGVYDAQTKKLRIYVNGKLEGESAALGLFSRITYNAYNGISHKSGNDANGYFQGMVDDPRIYDRTLTDLEIETVYQSGLSGETAVPSSNLAGGWRFDEGIGQSVSDYSGHAINGSLGLDGVVAADDPAWVLNQGVLDGTTETYFQTVAPIAASSNSSDYYLYYGSHEERGSAMSAPQASRTSLQMDGTNDYVSVPTSTSLDLTSAGTVSAWYKPTSTTASWTRIVSRNAGGGDTTGSYQIQVSPTLGSVVCNVGNSTTSQNLGSSVGITAGAWSLITCTWDGSNIKVYVNGASAGTVAQTVTPYVTTNPFSIGSTSGQPKGTIDDVRIYNRALSATEAADLYSNTSVVSLQGLRGWWRLDEGKGVSAADSSGNNNNGTLTNFNFDAASGWTAHENLWTAASAPTLTGAVSEGNSPLYFQWRTTSGPTTFGSWSALQPMAPDPVALGSSGVKLRFNPNGSYARYDTFRVASWAVEAFSTVSPQRGRRRSFPDKSNIVTTAVGVDIIDAETNKLWMRIPAQPSGVNNYLLGNNAILSAKANNGVLFVGPRWGNVGQIRIANLGDESAYLLAHMTSGVHEWSGNLALRADVAQTFTSVNTGLTNCSGNVNDLDIKVSGGKQYVALTHDTNGTKGVCLIQDATSLNRNSYSPAVREYSRTNPNDSYSYVKLTSSGTLYAANATQGGLDRWDNVFADTADQIGSADRTYSTSSTPALRSNAINDISVTEGTSLVDLGQNTVALATDLGTEVIEEHSTQASSQVRHYVKAGNKADSTSWNARVYGGALSLDGTNDSVAIPHQASLNSGTDFTMSTWFKMPSIPTGSTMSVLIDKGNWNTADSYSLSLYMDALRCSVGKSWAGGVSYASSNLQANTWYHVACTADGAGGHKMYLNGALVASAAPVPTAVTNTNTMYIGSMSNAASTYFTGLMDDMRLYNRALDGTEIKQLYGGDPLTAPTSGLVGYWPMNERSGQSVFDASGTGNDGTLGANSTAATDDPLRVVPSIAGESDKVTAVAMEKSGDSGRAMQFDGSNDFVNIGDPANDSLDFGTGSFSYGMWVNQPSFAGNWDMAWNKGGQSATITGYDMELGAGTWTVSIADGTSSKSVSMAAGSTGIWYHLFAVVDRTSNTLTLYSNGTKAAAPVSISGLGSVSTTSPAYIGKGSGTPYPFSGKISDIRLYSRALSGTEVATLYNGGAGTNKNPFPNLVGWWKLNDASGQTVIDSSVGGNYGTLGANSSAASDDPAWATGSPVKEQAALWVATNGAGADDGAVTAISLATDQPVTAYVTKASTVTEGSPDWLRKSNLTDNDIVSLSLIGTALGLVGTESGAWSPGDAGFPVDDTNPVVAGALTDQPVQIKGGTVRIKGGTVQVR